MPFDGSVASPHGVESARGIVAISAISTRGHARRACRCYRHHYDVEVIKHQPHLLPRLLSSAEAQNSCQFNIISLTNRRGCRVAHELQQEPLSAARLRHQKRRRMWGVIATLIETASSESLDVISMHSGGVSRPGFELFDTDVMSATPHRADAPASMSAGASVPVDRARLARLVIVERRGCRASRASQTFRGSSSSGASLRPSSAVGRFEAAAEFPCGRRLVKSSPSAELPPPDHCFICRLRAAPADYRHSACISRCSAGLAAAVVVFRSRHGA